MGRPDTDTLRDHWTVVTRDGLPSVHLEHTLAITLQGVVVVTADEDPPAPNGASFPAAENRGSELPTGITLAPAGPSSLADSVSLPSSSGSSL